MIADDYDVLCQDDDHDYNVGKEGMNERERERLWCVYVIQYLVFAAAVCDLPPTPAPRHRL